ncbi:MAG: AAA domain-containing protein [Firmicutes bacterium]|nr:AAA domain-containing protein [Bacillota bacterium]
MQSIERCPNGDYKVMFCTGQRSYRYGPQSVVWLREPMRLDVGRMELYDRVKKRKLRKITSVGLFVFGNLKVYAVTCNHIYTRHYDEDELEVRYSCLEGEAVSVLDYLRRCAALNTLGAPPDLGDDDGDEDDGSGGILSRIYDRIKFVDRDSAAALYLDPTRKIRSFSCDGMIFPFGCNGSQQQAVHEALTNQLSVIQGPPGTGKTQTILNIIANLLLQGKSVMVVSNNNSAIGNVKEKLEASGLGFLVAMLGNRANREEFIANQPTIPDEFAAMRPDSGLINGLKRDVAGVLAQTERLFSWQRELAACRAELNTVELELKHYIAEHKVSEQQARKLEVGKSPDYILKTLRLYNAFVDGREEYPTGLYGRLKRWINGFLLRHRLQMLVGEKVNTDVELPDELIEQIELKFYISRVRELKGNLERLERLLQGKDAGALMDELRGRSMELLRNVLPQKVPMKREPLVSADELYFIGKKFVKDYPVVLSTTFSARRCFSDEMLFDYMIMDEASQVSSETGFLALTCARNAVIVGDTKQLPNVVVEADGAKLAEIFAECKVKPCYDCGKLSFLSSVLETVADVPQTMLREHYRCHPDIIDFCNRKFYGGDLIVMTDRTDNDFPLMAITTVPGHHARGRYNQREIDAVKHELLPLLDPEEDIGIIAPYNRQVEQFRYQLPDIEAATIHKYQGRERDTIILSVTDDEITRFSDDANLLNVAVSRAKKRFCLVVSGNEQPLQGNICHLLGYIRYRKCEVRKSGLRSIFDYLHTNLAQDVGTVEPESETLTERLIEKVRTEHAELAHMKMLKHYPMRALIGDVSLLEEREAKYAMHPSTHVDFLIINSVTREPMLAVETDGYHYHKEGTEQYERDRMKDRILALYGLPLLRLSTVGHSEEQRLLSALLPKRTSGNGVRSRLK